MCFERKVMKGFVLPGIAVVILIIIMLFVQPWICTSILTRPVGGPPGMIIGMAMLPFALISAAYMVVTMAYTVFLPYKYFKHIGGFISSVRRFVLLSDAFFVLMDFMLVYAYIEVIRWNYFTTLNLSFVLPMTALIVFLRVFFFYWTKAIYRHEGRKVFAWKTVGILVLSTFILLAIAMLLFGGLFLYYELHR